jgi:hypothetical protein
MASEPSFFETLQRMCQVIGRYDDPQEALDLLGDMLKDSELQREFFKGLKSATWIGALRKAGYFDSPPRPERVEGGGIRHAPWPASAYLARMAKDAPQEVATILAGLETENSFIVGDLMDAALVMPAGVAAALVPALCKAAAEGTLWIRFDDASTLCARLASEGHSDAAMALAEVLFTPRFEEGKEKPRRPDVYSYKDGLKKALPALVTVRPVDFCRRLCGWLGSAIAAKGTANAASESDYSYIWRPAIEEHAQNSEHDFASEMVGFTRRALEEAVRNQSLALDAALGIVDEYPYLVFERLRVHLVNVFADRSPDLARQTMMDRGLFDDFEFKHEYAMLMGARFALLDAEQRGRWVKWVEAGPRKEGVDADLKEEVRQGQIRWWQFERLHWIRDHLEGRWQELYKQMRAEHGEPQMADLNTRVEAMAWGHESPMTIEELRNLTFAEAVERVASWKPDKPRFMGPGIEGLASMFGEYVAADPATFSQQARALIDRPAIYVRGFISKMAEGAKAGQDIDVLAILDLCRWVLAQPVAERTTPEQEHDVAIDKGWQWTRDEISQFVQAVCQSSADGKPRYPLEGLQKAIWSVLGQLEYDPATSYIAGELEGEDPRVHDYLILGINSPRGKAVRAGLEYARWVANHVKQGEVVRGGFDAMPEVRQMLEWQIAPENRSVEVLSIIGSHMWLIHWIDKVWLEQRANSIFDLKAAESEAPTAHGWSAWNAFLVWCRPHIEFYRLLKEQFAHAVREASKVELPESSSVRPQPMHRLGEHLMLLYGRGQLSSDQDRALLGCFLSESMPDIRRHAVGFVGESLQGDQKLPDGVVERFMRLWDWYWSTRGRDDAEEKPNDQLFGPWFACGRFPDQWSIEQLERFVRVAPVPEPEHEVMERLAAISGADIARATTIVDAMVRGDKEGWRIGRWRDSVKKILGDARSMGGEPREKAERLIDYLGRRGYTEFGELLKTG